MARRETSGLAKHFREATAAGVKKMRQKRGGGARPSAILVPANADTDLCFCGHVRDEHEGGTNCTVDCCACVHFEHDHETQAINALSETYF